MSTKKRVEEELTHLKFYPKILHENGCVTWEHPCGLSLKLFRNGRIRTYEGTVGASTIDYKYVHKKRVRKYLRDMIYHYIEVNCLGEVGDEEQVAGSS